MITKSTTPHSLRSSLFVISAPSGAGKTTLCSRLLKDLAQELILSISTTTRAPRGQEKNGIEYFFVSREDFEKKIAEKRFAEWANVHDNYYGTSKDFVEKAFGQKRSLLLDIDVQGAEQLRASYPQETVLIFIAPPSLEILEKRLRGRKTDSEETIQKRLHNARKEMQAMKSFDHVVVNDDLERAYAELKKIVTERISQHG